MRLVENLDEESFRKKIEEDKDVVILDVRTPVENQIIRIPNSILIDINNPNFADEINKLDRNKSYYIYCRVGERSYHAGNYMLRMGFQKVYNLRPGIVAWKGDKEISDTNDNAK